MFTHVDAELKKELQTIHDKFIKYYEKNTNDCKLAKLFFDDEMKKISPTQFESAQSVIDKMDYLRTKWSLYSVKNEAFLSGYNNALGVMQMYIMEAMVRQFAISDVPPAKTFDDKMIISAADEKVNVEAAILELKNHYKKTLNETFFPEQSLILESKELDQNIVALNRQIDDFKPTLSAEESKNDFEKALNQERQNLKQIYLFQEIKQQQKMLKQERSHIIARNIQRVEAKIASLDQHDFKYNPSIKNLKQYEIQNDQVTWLNYTIDDIQRKHFKLPKQVEIKNSINKKLLRLKGYINEHDQNFGRRFLFVVQEVKDSIKDFRESPALNQQALLQ